MITCHGTMRYSHVRPKPTRPARRAPKRKAERNTGQRKRPKNAAEAAARGAGGRPRRRIFVGFGSFGAGWGKRGDCAARARRQSPAQTANAAVDAVDAHGPAAQRPPTTACLDGVWRPSGGRLAQFVWPQRLAGLGARARARAMARLGPRTPGLRALLRARSSGLAPQGSFADGGHGSSAAAHDETRVKGVGRP